uniref:Uncharacterized protein n=1 Tax=Solanum lycopersicum TaxID=4081 RepID=A0A3Q7F1P2_SOLLC
MAVKQDKNWKHHKKQKYKITGAVACNHAYCKTSEHISDKESNSRYILSAFLYIENQNVQPTLG